MRLLLKGVESDDGLSGLDRVAVFDEPLHDNPSMRAYTGVASRAVATVPIVAAGAMCEPASANASRRKIPFSGAMTRRHVGGVSLWTAEAWRAIMSCAAGRS